MPPVRQQGDDVSSSKAPWWPRYVRDYLADTLDLTLEEDGAYTRLLDWQWMHGCVPDTPAGLAAVMRVPPAKAKRLWVGLARFFPERSGDGWQNRRMERERGAQMNRSAQAQFAAKELHRQRRERSADADADAYADAPADALPKPLPYQRQRQRQKTNSLSEDRKPGPAEPIGAIVTRITKAAS